MNDLLLKDCGPFFEYFHSGILKSGLLDAMAGFQTDSPSMAVAIHSWHHAFSHGKSFPDALRAMSGRFPRCVEELLILAAERSVLDAAVSDILRLYPSTQSEREMIESVARLLDRYRSSSPSGIICDGCFERDFLKILRRAEVEEANEVILAQEGELFFHQIYLGVKPVHITEPCHSMVFTTVKGKLRSACENGNLLLTTSSGAIGVARVVEGRYRVTFGSQSLTVTFEANSLSPKTEKILEEWWASFLGFDKLPAAPTPFSVTPHPGFPNLGGYGGIYVLSRKGSVSLSAPEALCAKLSEYLSSAKDAVTTSSILGILPRLGTTIGPAFIGYRDTAVSVSTVSHTHVEIPFDDARVAKFRERVSAAEWDEAGICEHQERIFAILDGDKIVALGGYERFERSDSPIGHMSVIVDSCARHRGYAKAVVSNLVTEILARGLIPQYRALCSNTGSIRVAESLGFVFFADQCAVRNPVVEL